MRPLIRHFLGLALLTQAIAGAAPAQAATMLLQVNASAVKPLTLSWLQDMDLGSVALGPGTWSGATVSISRAGVFSCTSANLTCSGTTKVAQYNVTGSNRGTVRISVPNVTLVNQGSTSQTLLLTVDSPASVVLTNSGAPGTNFSIGGSITLTSATAGGTYSGTFNVTVDYQ